MQPMPQRALGERERFVAFAFAAADLLVEIGPDQRIVFAAGAFRARLGNPPESFIGQPAVNLLALEDRPTFAAALAVLPARGRLPPTSFRLADAARTPVAISGLHMLSFGKEGQVCMAISPLPSAPEPRLAEPGDLLREGRERMQAGGGAAIGLIELGEVPPEGLARRIDSVLAQEVPPGTLAARLGPGRYGLLPDAGAGPLDLGALAGRLGEALEQEGADASVSTSALPLATDGLTSAQAARALRYGLGAFARLGGEGLRGAGFADGLGGVVAMLGRRAATLRRIVSTRDFRLDFQPIVDLATRQVHHHEALLRLEPGLLAPGEGPQDFVALAETLGLTEELDLAVATLALAGSAALPEGQRIAFNISGLSAQSAGFRTRLLALLDRDPRGASRLMVELTESAEIEEEAFAAATLQALRARGVPVCIDDFGAGAAAFRYLKAFPTDYVKVDGAFVHAALSCERDRSFVAAMVDLSIAVGARVVAERIETEEAAAAMHGLGVHYGQGWLFGRPGPL